MTVQIDTGQVAMVVFSALGGQVLTMVVQDWRRRRREQDTEVAREAQREAEENARNERHAENKARMDKQHAENKARMDEMTRLLEAAFGAHGRLGFLVHRQELQALRVAHQADHVRLNGHATMIEGHKEQINGLRRDVDELRRAE